MYIQIFSLEFDFEWAWVVKTLLSDGLGWTWIYDNLLLLAQIFCLTVALLSVNNKNKKLVPLASSPFPCSVLPLNFSIFFLIFNYSLLISIKIVETKVEFIRIAGIWGKTSEIQKNWRKKLKEELDGIGLLLTLIDFLGTKLSFFNVFGFFINVSSKNFILKVQFFFSNCWSVSFGLRVQNLCKFKIFVFFEKFFEKCLLTFKEIQEKKKPNFLFKKRKSSTWRTLNKKNLQMFFEKKLKRNIWYPKPILVQFWVSKQKNISAGRASFCLFFFVLQNWFCFLFSFVDASFSAIYELDYFKSNSIDSLQFAGVQPRVEIGYSSSIAKLTNRNCRNAPGQLTFCCFPIPVFSKISG